MTDEKINIAMAKACGWRVLDPEVKPDIIYLWGLRKGFIHEENREIIPDYCNDLNVMHRAEKMLTEHQWDEYERALRLVCDGCSYYEGAGKELLHATAAQRAEAFLRTLGKWGEA